MLTASDEPRSMRKLTIPRALEVEFATLEAIWHSAAQTRGVDALVLAWVKYEKQLRRLFCFLVFQHSKIGAGDIDQVITTLVQSRALYPETFIKGINVLGVATVPQLLGAEYNSLWTHITRIKKHRNKLIHGQISGKRTTTRQLEEDVLWIIQWIGTLATSANSLFGYDGLKRNTYRVAKSVPAAAVAKYPFCSTLQFEEWLNDLIH